MTAVDDEGTEKGETICEGTEVLRTRQDLICEGMSVFL